MGLPGGIIRLGSRLVQGRRMVVFCPSNLHLAGTDARRGLDVALKKARAAAADSSAVLIVREVQRDYDPTGMAHAIHRITVNTGWVRRSSAKAHLSTAARRVRARPTRPLAVTLCEHPVSSKSAARGEVRLGAPGLGG
jgi:hypothetical protein